MLSPRRSQVILLPEDRKLIDLLGWEEDQYRYFVKQASTFNDIRPGEPTAFLVVPFLIKLVIGLALSYLGSLLSRRQSNNPAQLTTQNVDGQNIVSGGRFAPRAGFSSTQNVVEMGSVIPVVFAKRELIDGVWYGGVRVNTNLLWSQLFSQGTGQLLRAVFMVSEGPIGALDPRQFAIGDNLLGGYDLDPTNNTSGRVSVYFRPGGGLIRATDHIAGRLAANDEGNAENSGGASVFDVRGVNEVYNNDFSYASKPNNQTAFGLYAPMGNDLAYRVNPVIRPTSSPQLKPFGNNGASVVSCNADTSGKAERMKYNAVFTSRSGVIIANNVETANGQSVDFAIGDTFVYRLDSSSDYPSAFLWLLPPFAAATCIDVAQAIAGRQRQWDDAIVVGELYKFGTCYAICTGRTPSDAVFISEAENTPRGGGVTIDATFRVVKCGTAICSSAAAITRYVLAPGGGISNNGTQRSHLFRVAVSTFIVDRPTQVIEVGYKSALGIRYSGLCNFRDSSSGLWADLLACDAYTGAVIGSGQTFNTANITSGTITLSEKRYSFFRVGCRAAGTDAAFVEIDANFCIVSQTQQATYNYLRLQFPTAQRWEIQHLPISGWEIRNNLWPGPFIVLDSRIAGPAQTGSSNGFVYNYSGEVIANNSNTFKLAPTIPRTDLSASFGDLGAGPKDGSSYVDEFGALAEVFSYEEVQSSASQPEHEIAYVNLITPNPVKPNYAKIATVGLTLRSGPSFSELNQLSVYVNCGFGATHLFPECYAIALTNPDFGAGKIQSAAQIDFGSFQYSATWTYNRRYFFDIGISDPVNLRSKGAEWARLFLLDLSTKNGKFHLSPVAEFGVQYSPTALFTSGNADSVSVAERDSQERRPIRVSVKWREERQASDIGGVGLFPIIRELNVREAGTEADIPLVQIDISEFATSELHALDVAKMRCREQRLVTHDVTIECLPDRNALEPGAIIKVGMELLAYEQPNNGIILADGSTTATSGASLTDGTYNVVLWDGTGALQEVAISVTAGKVVGYSNAVFCIADAVQATQTFKAQVISYNDEGNLEITASYYPLDENGYSLLLDDWNAPGAWVIEGMVGSPPPEIPPETPPVDPPGLPPSIPLEPAFTGVAISGAASAVRNTSSTYIAQVNGPSGVYTYAWSGTGITFSSTTVAAPVVTFTGTNTATLNVTVTRTSDNLARSASKVVSITAPVDNSVSIGGPNSRIGSGTIALSADIALPFTSATYEWSVDGEGTLSSTTASSTVLTVSGLNQGLRTVSLSAVVDGVTHTALKLLNVLPIDPLVIVGPSFIGVGAQAYSGVLSPDLPPGDWTYQWGVIQNPPVEPPVMARTLTALPPTVTGSAIVNVPPSAFTLTALPPVVTGT